MPEIGELDKLLIQDLLDRRNKHREGILNSLRPLGIALTAGVALYVSKIFDPTLERRITTNTLELTSVVLFFGTLLSFGFVWLNAYHFAVLEDTGKELNARLQPWRERIDDTRALRMAMRLVKIGLLFTLTLLVMFVLVAIMAYLGIHPQPPSHSQAAPR